MNQQSSSYPQEPEFSLKGLIRARIQDLKYLLGFRKVFAIAILAGALIGVLLAWKWPVTYTARLTFVVEDTKGSGGGLISSLAGQFGVDLGGVGSSSGVLAGDNVQELLKSQKMIQRTLLTPYSGSTSLADAYAEAYGLKDKWKKHKQTGGAISFPLNDKRFTRLQDSLLQVMAKDITEKELSIKKTDKKLTFFELSTTTRDEKFSKLFTERLIQQATDFYIKTKTKTLRTNIAHLERRADSITRILNKKTYSTYASNKVLLDLNPAYPTANAGIEVNERDKMVLSTIYSEIVKNLEANRTMLIQETPTFQVVDEPNLPLKKNRLGFLKAIVISVFLLTVLLAIYLFIRREFGGGREEAAH